MVAHMWQDTHGVTHMGKTQEPRRLADEKHHAAPGRWGPVHGLQTTVTCVTTLQYIYSKQQASV